jgi:hypothetical protein
MDISQLVLKASSRNLTEEDMTSYCQTLSLTRHDLFDALSEYLARGFVARELSFSFCDIAVNEILGLANYDASEFTWSVYRAFEEGEGYHPGDSRDIEPSEVYVRPLLEQLLLDRAALGSGPNKSFKPNPLRGSA